MEMAIIIITLIIGLLLLMAELLLLPGITLAGIGAALLFAVSIGYGYSLYGLGGGLIIFGIAAILSLILFLVSLRAKTWKRLSLSSTITSTAGQNPEQVSVGDTGHTTTRLAPIGKVEINGKSYEAKSEASYIDARQGIVVTAVEGNEIIVKQA